MTRNEFSAAMEFYQQKYQIDRNLCEREPKNPTLRRDLSMSLGRLGDMSLQHGQPREALHYYKERHDIAQELAEADPNNVVAQQDLAFSYELLGNSAAYLQDPELVLSSYQKMNEIQQRLFDAEPNNIVRQRTLWISLTKLGNFYDDTGQSDVAIDYYARGIGLIEALAVADRLNVKTQTELFMAYVNLGTCESIRNNFEASAAWLRKGRDVLLPLQEKKLLTGQLQNAVAHIDQQLENVDYFAKAVADLDFALTQPAAQIPSLISLRMQMLIRKSDRNAAVETATRLSTLASSQPVLCLAAARTWNVASLLSQDDEQFQSHCVSQAIIVLKTIETGEAEPIESPAALAKALLEDPELSRLREHADFNGFVQSLQTP
jgi:tetratricopeptide (TPR) repeat protein